MREFRLAPMSSGLWWLTSVLLAVPALMLVALLAGVHAILAPLVFVLAIYAWVWVRFRPTKFVIQDGAVEVVWPLKRMMIARSSIVSARIVGVPELKNEVGWGARVGAGGLWGGFGWLWTKRRGVVQMYISRTDAFVWIERGTQRPWLVTPAQPEEFVNELLSWSNKRFQGTSLPRVRRVSTAAPEPRR